MWRHTAEHQESGVLYLHEEPSAMNSIPSVVSVRWLEMRVNECPWSGQGDEGTSSRRTRSGLISIWPRRSYVEAVPNSGLGRRVGGLDSKQQLLWLGASLSAISQPRRQLPLVSQSNECIPSVPPAEFFFPAAGMSIS